jgi:protein-disulfide isomerase
MPKENDLPHDIIRRMNSKNTPTQKEKKLAALKRKEFNALTSIVAFALGIMVGYFVWGYNAATDLPSQAVDSPPPAAEAPNLAPAQRLDVPTEGFPSEGPDDAPIVIVEFSDFECPFCTKWHNEVYQPLLEEYPDQIKLVYRNFPLTSIHANAHLAAEAAMCAGDQNSYWAYHEKLFESEYGLGILALNEYASELQLDTATFEECVSSRQYEDFVKDDMNYAISIGVQSTPTFYINGQIVIGAQPIQVFRQIIDSELAGDS